MAARVAGLFILLYAQSLAACVRLRRSDVVFTDQGVAIRFASEPIQLPDSVAQLVHRYLEMPSERAIYRNTETNWLFGDLLPSSRVTETHLGRIVASTGVPPRLAKEAAMRPVATSLRARVVADAIGVAVGTTSKWSRTSGGWDVEGLPRSEMRHYPNSSDGNNRLPPVGRALFDLMQCSDPSISEGWGDERISAGRCAASHPSSRCAGTDLRAWMLEEFARHGYKISPVLCIRHCTVSKSTGFSNPNLLSPKVVRVVRTAPPRLVGQRRSRTGRLWRNWHVKCSARRGLRTDLTEQVAWSSGVRRR